MAKIYDYPIEKYKVDPNTVDGLYPMGKKFLQTWAPANSLEGGERVFVEVTARDEGHACSSGCNDCVHQSISVKVLEGELKDEPYTVLESRKA